LYRPCRARIGDALGDDARIILGDHRGGRVVGRQHRERGSRGSAAAEKLGGALQEDAPVEMDMRIFVVKIDESWVLDPGVHGALLPAYPLPYSKFAAAGERAHGNVGTSSACVWYRPVAGSCQSRPWPKQATMGGTPCPNAPK